MKNSYFDRFCKMLCEGLSFRGFRIFSAGGEIAENFPTNTSKVFFFSRLFVEGAAECVGARD